MEYSSNVPLITRPESSVLVLLSLLFSGDRSLDRSLFSLSSVRSFSLSGDGIRRARK